jgi:microtubule-associated serine/threonine kinase
LLLQIARPARLIECLEFDPQDAASALHDASGHERISQLKSLVNHDHMPQYILSKLQTTFGPQSTGYPSDAQQITSTMGGMCAPQQTVEFIDPNVLPSKHDFKFEKQLSAGAYGAVFLARHKQTSEYVAIKVLKKKHLLAKNMIDQVVNERDILQFAQNPFLVTLYCSFSTKVARS